MYGALWRRLPGGWALKTLQSLVLVALVCTVLVLFVFPWVEPKLPFSENTVDGGGGSSQTTTPTATPTAPATGGPTRPPATQDVPDVLPGD